MKQTYGAENLEENLQSIAEGLGRKGNSREAIRNYFLTEFYRDHCQTYQKRPIYRLFDSGKKHGFKALVYLHRYERTTVARIRTDYIFRRQAYYRRSIADCENIPKDATTSERVKMEKEARVLRAQSEELRAYEEKIHDFADRMVELDLDDGVKKNYEIFASVLAGIK